MKMLGLFPALLLGLSAWNFVGARRFSRAALPAEGQVVEWQNHLSVARGGHATVTHYPLIRFRASNGREYDFVCRTGHGEGWPPAPGSKLRVLYDPARPEEARLDRFSEIWGSTLLLGEFGFFFAVFPLAAWALFTRAARQRPTARK